jgi:tRNA A-37 threonylcarbamoyl transferase component Bud32
MDTCPVMESDGLVASRFGEWRVVDGQTLRRGGQADVFVVARPGAEERHVLKRLRNPNRRARFEREVETMRALATSGVPVPPVVAEGITTDADARPYYVMLLYERGSLQAAVEDERYGNNHAAGIDLLRAVARALADMHACGCAHRDIKPANVLLDDGQPLLADLGLALTVEEQQAEPRLTDTGEAVGSRLYIAPENESGFNLDVDQRPADCYAFAKLAWALLAGNDPPARELQSEPARRLATISGIAELSRLDSLFEELLVLDPRARLTDWHLVDQELAATARALRGETSSFEFWLGLLERYVEKNGTAAVASKTVFDGLRLGRWCGRQRRLYGQGKLSEDRTERLHALPGWQWVGYDAGWERMFALLDKYVAREKTIAVPRDHLEEGERLGNWVRKQRTVYNGVHAGGRLTERQIVKLVALPGWSWDLQGYKWERGFQALRSFVEREHHVNVPPGHVELGVNLYAWVNRQQQHYKMGRLQRQGDRLARLDAIEGWKWWLPVADRWERNYEALVAFQEREGHVQPPEGHFENGVSLWRWVGYQRLRYADGKLLRYPDRIARLEAIPGWEWPETKRRRAEAA